MHRSNYSATIPLGTLRNITFFVLVFPSLYFCLPLINHFIQYPAFFHYTYFPRTLGLPGGIGTEQYALGITRIVVHTRACKNRSHLLIKKSGQLFNFYYQNLQPLQSLLKMNGIKDLISCFGCHHMMSILMVSTNHSIMYSKANLNVFFLWERECDREGETDTQTDRWRVKKRD